MELRILWIIVCIRNPINIVFAMAKKLHGCKTTGFQWISKKRDQNSRKFVTDKGIPTLAISCKRVRNRDEIHGNSLKSLLLIKISNSNDLIIDANRIITKYNQFWLFCRYWGSSGWIDSCESTCQQVYTTPNDVVKLGQKFWLRSPMWIWTARGSVYRWKKCR